MAWASMGHIAHGANSASYAQIWAGAELIRKDATAQTFFTAYDGATLGRPGGRKWANAAVVDYTRLLKTPMAGDTATITLFSQLHGEPTESTMMGNEEDLTTGTIDISIARKRHAVAYERYGQDKAFWSWQRILRQAFVPFLARWKDKRAFDAMISGRTAVFDGLNAGVSSRALCSSAGVASAAMTVSALDKIGLKLASKNADPLTFASGRDGAQIPGYGVVMSPDQYADLLAEGALKSAMQLSIPTGPDHPLRSGAMFQYKNLFIFSLGGDLWDGGSPLQPRAKVYATLTTASGASILYVSTSGSAASLTKYFPSSGYLIVYTPGKTKRERIHYKGKGKYYFALTTKRAAAVITSHLAASSVVALDVNHVVAFGREVIGKVETIDPQWITDSQDYGEILGQGYRWVEGYRALNNTAGKYPGIITMQCVNDRTVKLLD